MFDAAKGRVAVAFGDPDGADNIAVMVPGMSTTMWNFGGVMKDAERLKGAMDKYAADPGVANAVVAWLDYDPPDVNPQSLDLLRAASEDRAREGAAALRPFVDGMNANAPDSNLTVVGHSYGSLTTGIAARDGHLGADDVVFIGSPGTGVRHASDLHLDPGAQVFAAAADGDLVTKVPEASGRAGNLIGAGIGGAIAGPGGAVAGWVLGGNATDNWHGVAPTDSSYGATVFGTDGSHGHSEYYKAGRESQINIALIATRGQPTP